MRRIFRYEFPALKFTAVQVPIGAKPVLVAGQPQRCGDHTLVLWLEEDTAAEYEHRTFAVYPTGEAFTENWLHVGSAVVGPYVWHLYEAKDQGIV